MKRNVSVAYLGLGVVLLFILAASAVLAKSAITSHDVRNSAQIDPQTPGAVIKNFYNWYINAVEAGTDPFKKGRAMLQKYVTLRLIEQIERSETDADTFLQTQEWDKAWADAATVSGVRVNGATATAIVTFDAALNYPRVSVTLVKEAGIWKIDKVKNAPLSSR